MTLEARAYGVAYRRAMAAWRIVTGDDLGFYRRIGDEVLHNLQRGACYMCGAGFDGEGPRSSAPLAKSREHVFPRVRNGQEKGNVLLAHRRCNEVKGPRWPTPCEVLYLAAIYAPPHDRAAWRNARTLQRQCRRQRRLAAIERWWGA